jgi:hypothetical protein
MDFLRKRTKILMVIFGSLLMISFVAIPQVMNRGGGDQPNKVKVGTLAGKKLTRGDVSGPENYLRYLQAFLQFTYQSGNTQEAQQLQYQLIPPLDGRDRALCLFLLNEEAEKFGIAVTPDEVIELIKSAKLSTEQLRTFFTSYNTSEATLRQAVTTMTRVMKVMKFARESATQMSLPELEHLATSLRSEMNLRFIKLDARLAPVDAKQAVPLAAAIQAQFDLYKDILPNQVQPPEVAGQHFPFGYKIPDRVQIEYIKVDYAQIRGSMKPSREDLTEAYKRYRENPSQFAETPATTQTTQPTTAPSFDTVRDRIIEQILSTRAMGLTVQISDKIAELTSRPWNKTDTKGYRVLDGELVNYETVALAIEKQFGYLPTVIRLGSWQTAESVDNLKGLGDARVRMANPESRNGADFLKPSELIFSIREFISEPKGMAQKLHGQARFELPILQDPMGGRYVARVLTAEPAHAPKELTDEIRSQVVTDLNLKAAFDAYVAQAQAIVAAAPGIGLQAAIRKTGGVWRTTETGLFAADSLQNILMGSGMAQPIPVIGNIPEVKKAAIGLTRKTQAASSLPVVPAVNIGPSTASAPAPQAEPIRFGDRMIAAGTATVVPDSVTLCVYAMELADFRPMPMDQFGDSKMMLAYYMQMRNQQWFTQQWVKLEALAQRVNFVPEKAFDGSSKEEVE